MAAAIAALCLVCDGPALAQPVAAPDKPEHAQAAPIPSTPDPVQRAIDAAYLSDEQRHDKRIFFGRYTADDLNTPARVARAALMRGAYDDPALDIDDADPLDRAEALARRGEFASAAAILDKLPTQPIRATRIRCQMLEQQGRFDDAVHIAEPVIDQLARRKLTDAADITDAVLLADMRTRLAGPRSTKGTDAARDYEALAAQLDDVLNRIDRLYWPAKVAQAALLAAHDNKQEAAQVLDEAIKLNPACAEAWNLLAEQFVSAFAFAQAEKVAKRLDLLAGDWTGEDPDPTPAELEAADAGATSPEAAMIVARTLLRQSEGAAALKALEPHLARWPHSPRLLALKCAALAVSFDFQATDLALAEFDKQFNNSPEAQYEVGRALSESRQYAQSKVHLEEAAKRQPNGAEPYIELGLMLLQAGDDVGAGRALERACALDPFNARADNSLRLAREMATYERVETRHYTIRYKPGARPDGTAGDALLAREMGGPLERNYAIVTGREQGGIDYEPKQKTIIDLMPDHKWFGVRIAGMPQIHTIAASTGPVIAMESPRDGANHLGTYDWVRVLRHEFTHTVTLGRTNNRIPHWYTEASAVYLEQSPRDWPTVQLLAAAHRQKSLFDFSEISLAFVRPKKPTDRQLAYAQGHWMYEYIIARGGPRAPLDLMDKYATGVREEEAFQSVLGISRARFLEDFLVWSKQQLVEWGMEVPEGTPTLRQLQAREALAMQSPGGDAPAPEAKKTEGGDDAKPAPEPEKPDAQADKGKSDAEKARAEHIAALHRIADGKATDPDDEVDLPDTTPEFVAKYLAEYPKHADLLELAMDEQVEKAGGKATPEIVDIIERYAAARPVDPKPHRLLAKMYLDAAASDPATMREQAAKAIPHLEFLDDREQKVPTYAMELAKRYVALGDLEHARARAERATQIDPFDARPRELAAGTALQAKDYAGAERHITALTLIEPTRQIHKERLEALKKLKEGVK